ncbi:MAG: RNA methyltransferase, partial [Coriobacteriia bacterium]|nr:RNA methyltransferase [Coriobacteriia bacterium]
MSEMIEGRNAVLEALRSGVQLEHIMLAEGMRPNPGIEEIRRLASASGIPVEDVARSTLDRQSVRGAHQGVIASSAAFEYAELEDVLRAIEGVQRSLVVVLDHITDPGNLGAVIRSVEVAGGSAVLIPRDRAASVGPVAHKASAGATAH